jgi:hypothetical protein
MHRLDGPVAGGAGDRMDDVDALIQVSLPPLPPTNVPVVLGSSSDPSQPTTATVVPFCWL